MEKIKIADLEIGYQDLLKAQSELAEGIRATKESTAELLAEQQKLRDEGRAGTQQYERNAKAIEENKVVLAGLNTEYKHNEKVLTSSVAAQSQSLGTIDKLNAENAKLRQLMRGLNLDTDEGKKKQKEYILQVNKNTEFIRQNSDAYVQQKMNIGNYKSALDLLPPSLQGGVRGFQAIGNAAKVFLANPIVLVITAIVAAVAGLIKAFKGTEEGGDRLKKMFDKISAVIGVIKERIENFATGLFKVFSGEAKLKDLKGTFKGLGDEMAREVKLAGELADMMDQLEDREIDMITISAMRKAQIDKLKEAAADQNKTDEQRISLLSQAQRLIDEEAKSQQGLLLTKIANELATTDEAKVLERLNQLRKEGKQITLEEIGLGNATNVDRKRVNELIAQYIGMEEQAATEKRRSAATISGLVKQQREEQEALNNELIESAKRYNDTVVKESIKSLESEIAIAKSLIASETASMNESLAADMDSYLQGIDTMQAAMLADIENEKQLRIMAADDMFAQKREMLLIEHDEEVANAKRIGADTFLIEKKYSILARDLKRQEEQAKLDIMGGFSGAIAQLFGEETRLGKAAAVVQTVINTYKGAMAAFAETPGGIVIKSLAAGTAVATGSAAVRNILKTGGSSGGASASISDISGTGSAGTEASASQSSNMIAATTAPNTVLVIEDFQKVNDNVVKVKSAAEL